MSLKVWLPLIDNLNNQGTDTVNIQNNGATVNSSGKLGSCYSFNGSSNYLFSEYNFYNLNYSVSAWIYTTSTSATQTIVCDRVDVGYGFSTFLIGGKLRIDAGGNNLMWTTSYSYPANTWFHLAVTYDGTNVSYYINGVFKEKKAQALNSSKWGNITSIGASQTNGSGYGNYLNGRLNDIRIYDHCLSAKEVKEISQGLVLHYKLEGGLGGVGKNLTPCGSLYTKESPWTTSKANADGYAFVTNSAFEGKPSTTYTISVECDGTLSSSHSAGGIPISNKPWAFWAYICNVDTTKAWTSGGYDRAVVLTNSNNNYRKIGNRHAWTITLSSTEKYISLRTNSYSDGSTPVTINWWNIKVEEGTNRTPWVDSLIDSNYDDTKVVDSSGYNHVGSLMGNPTTFSESSRYLVSTNFDGIDDGVLIENLNLSPVINSNITYSFWIKPWGENGARSIYFGSYSGTSWSVEKTAGNLLRLYWNGSPDETCTGLSITDGVWQHIAVVKSGTNDVKAYLNGVQKWSSSAAHNTLTFPTTYRLARDTRSNDNTPYKGQMADFRIYATALSAADILDLYHTSANIDNLGRVHGFEISEIAENKFFKVNLAINGDLDKASNGVGTYSQSNCTQTYENNSIRIYRPPNLVHDSSTMHNMWGGVRIRNSSVNSCHEYNSDTDNLFNLQKGHTYIIYFKVKGQSSNAATSIGWTNQMGWSGGGLNPAPSNVEYLYTPVNFNGEMDCFYKFTINDEIVKTCTSSYSYAVSGKQYLSYNDFMYGFGYENTGTLGTDVYVSNYRLYDITDIVHGNISLSGIINFLSFNEDDYNHAKISKYGEMQSIGFIEK